MAPPIESNCPPTVAVQLCHASPRRKVKLPGALPLVILMEKLAGYTRWPPHLTALLRCLLHTCAVAFVVLPIRVMVGFETLKRIALIYLSCSIVAWNSLFLNLGHTRPAPAQGFYVLRCMHSTCTVSNRMRLLTALVAGCSPKANTHLNLYEWRVTTTPHCWPMGSRHYRTTLSGRAFT